MKKFNRRLKMSYISKDIILELFNRKEVGCIKIIKGVPRDTQVINIVYDHLRDCFCVLLEHPSFEHVPLNEVIPLVDIVYQKVYPQKRISSLEILKDRLNKRMDNAISKVWFKNE